MLVAVERFDLRIRDSHSLKQKRHVVKGLIAAVRQRFDVAVAEVDHQDLWQRTAIGVVAVGNEEYRLRRVMHEIEKLVDHRAEVELIASELSVLDPDD
jgi:uncharacterized protein YlxP (DUF503 family)